jgi:acyl-coenzyme A synthetase/AMP-(fatty) acid ligase
MTDDVVAAPMAISESSMLLAPAVVWNSRREGRRASCRLRHSRRLRGAHAWPTTRHTSRDRHGHTEMPETLRVVEAFPRTASGKVQKHLLRN